MPSYYLTVSADANDIVTSSIAVAASSVTPYGSAAPLSGSYITTSALSATPNSKVLAVSGGDLNLLEGVSAISINSSFLRTGTSPLALALSGSYEQLSAVQFCGTASGALLRTTNHSGGTPEACPVPNPYTWMCMGTDGTAGQTLLDFGSGGSVSGASSIGHMFWDQSNTRLFVSAAGVYRATATAILVVAGSTAVELGLYVDGVVQHVTTNYIHNLVDPEMVMLEWVGFVAAGSNIRLTRDPTSSQNTNFAQNSTFTVTRLA